MLARLQEIVDRQENAGYDAIVLGYGLCGLGLVGLMARTVPLVIPCAHDCITFFMGSKERYLEYFYAHPGVYFKTSGWIERADGSPQSAGAGKVGACCYDDSSSKNYSYDELVAKYGEEDAREIYDILTGAAVHYNQLTYIDMGVGPSAVFEKIVIADAASNGWKYERIRGDMSLMQRLVDGPWDDGAFLVLKPGFRIDPSYDLSVITAKPG
jgi:hypothetical protein